MGDKFRSVEPDFFSQQVSLARRFYLNLKPSTLHPFDVVSGGFEQCSKEYVISRRSFPFFVLEFVSSGQGRLKLQGQAVDLSPGTIFTYGPGFDVHIAADGREPPGKYFIAFQGRDAARFLAVHKLTPGTVCRVSDPLRVQQLFDDMIRDGVGGGPIAAKLCNALAQYLVVRVGSLLDAGEHSTTAAYATYRRCRDFIEQNYVRLHTLNSIANGLHLDRTYLCRLFKRYDHETPHQLLTRLKMQKGAELLANSDQLIRQVANVLGYADPFHFSRTFKKSLGVSPKSFRQRHR